MSSRSVIIILVVLVAVAAAVIIGGAALLGVFSNSTSTDTGAPDADGTGSTQGTPVPGPPLSVEEALLGAAGSSQPFLVTGYLFVYADGSARLSDMILESYPPQPGGATLELQGLDPSAFELSSEGTVSWSEVPVAVLGTIDAAAGVMTVSSTSL